MIVKIYTKELHPGMHVTNPGLSQESNPHVFLVECGIPDRQFIDDLIANGMVEVFIDTDKGDYFVANKHEKIRLETPYAVVATDAPDEVNASANFDTLTTDRCYKKAQHTHKALSIIFNSKGGSFSPAMVDRFVRFIGVYPVGSIVVLQNGKRAIVVEQNPESLLRPKIRIVLDENNRYCAFENIDLFTTPDDDWGLKIIDCVSYQECRINVAEFIPGLKTSKLVIAGV